MFVCLFEMLFMSGYQVSFPMLLCSIVTLHKSIHIQPSILIIFIIISIDPNQNIIFLLFTLIEIFLVRTFIAYVRALLFLFSLFYFYVSIFTNEIKILIENLSN